MSKELLLVVDAVANEKGVAKEVIFEAMEAALASAAKKRYIDQDVLVRVSINRNSPANTRPSAAGKWWPTTWSWSRRTGRMRLMDAVDEARTPGRRLHRRTDRKPGVRPHRRAGRQAGHRAARARSRARAGRRCLRIGSANWSPASSSASSAAHLSRPRRQCRGLHRARQGHPARERARRRPRARLPVTTCAPSRAARSCSSRAPRPNS
jgi:hypothetical protein